MKIHSYKIIEIKSYLEDIFQELKDIGFLCSVRILEDGTPYFSIRIQKESLTHKGLFKFDSIKDYIESAIDYMGSIGYDSYAISQWDISDMWTYIKTSKSGVDVEYAALNGQKVDVVSDIKIIFEYF